MKYTEFLDELRRFFSVGGKPVDADVLKDWYDLFKINKITTEEFKKALTYICINEKKPEFVNLVFEVTERVKVNRKSDNAKKECERNNEMLKKWKKNYDDLSDTEKEAITKRMRGSIKRVI